MVAGLSARVEVITSGLLDAMARRPTLDLIDSLALPLPLTVIAEMLGVSTEDRVSLRTLFSRLADPDAVNPLGILRNLPRMRQLSRFVRRLITQRREQVSLRPAGACVVLVIDSTAHA